MSVFQIYHYAIKTPSPEISIHVVVLSHPMTDHGIPEIQGTFLLDIQGTQDINKIYLPEIYKTQEIHEGPALQDQEKAGMMDHLIII